MKKLILVAISLVILTNCAYKVQSPVKPLSFIRTNSLDNTKIRYD